MKCDRRKSQCGYLPFGLDNGNEAASTVPSLCAVLHLREKYQKTKSFDSKEVDLVEYNAVLYL